LAAGVFRFDSFCGVAAIVEVSQPARRPARRIGNHVATNKSIFSLNWSKSCDWEPRLDSPVAIDYFVCVDFGRRLGLASHDAC